MHWTLTCSVVFCVISVVLYAAFRFVFIMGWGAGVQEAAIASINTPRDPWWREMVRMAQEEKDAMRIVL